MNYPKPSLEETLEFIASLSAPKPKDFVEAAKVGNVDEVTKYLNQAQDIQILLKGDGSHPAFRYAVEYARYKVVLELSAKYSDEGLREALTMNKHEALGQTIKYIKQIGYKEMHDLILSLYARIQLEVPPELKRNAPYNSNIPTPFPC